MSSGGDEWGIDLTPVRPGDTATSEVPDDAEEPAAVGAQQTVPLDLVATLVDMRRSIDRIALRLARMESLLEAASEPVEDGELSDVAVRRFKRRRPQPLPPPVQEGANEESNVDSSTSYDRAGDV